MSTVRDKQLKNTLSIMQDNDNKLNIIKVLENVKKDIEIAENTHKTYNIIHNINNIISSIEKSHCATIDIKPGASLGAILV